jgi:hypothetical protein
MQAGRVVKPDAEARRPSARVGAAPPVENLPIT